MNVALTILAVMILAAQSVFADPSGLITIAWGYTNSLITPDLGFVITASTNLTVPLTNWPVIVCTSHTNCTTTNTSYYGTNCTEFRQKFQIQPGAMFFVCYASNFWGMSSNSNVCSTPPLPLPVFQTITRTN